MNSSSSPLRFRASARAVIVAHTLFPFAQGAIFTRALAVQVVGALQMHVGTFKVLGKLHAV